jgi:hypothetical protein
VQHWLKLQHGSPIKLRRRSPWHHTLLACLGKKFHPSGDYDLKQYPCSIEIQLHGHDLTHHGKVIQPQVHRHLNNVIEEEIKNALFLYIHAHYLKGMSIAKATMVFQAQLGYTEDIFSRDAISKAYFRRKTELENIFSGTVPKFKTQCILNP